MKVEAGHERLQELKHGRLMHNQKPFLIFSLMCGYAGFERNGDADMARQVYDEMQAAGLQPTQPAPGPPAAKATPFIDHIGRKMKQVHSCIS